MSFLDLLMVKIALIGVLGIGAQWIAWRSGRPAIALMLIVGVLAGPVSALLIPGGLINPTRDFGALMQPIIKLAVAVILFEGGLSLNFRDLRHAGWPVLRLVIIGVPIGWAMGTAAAYYGAGLSLPIATLFGGIMIVTGPTVVGPLLRTIRLPPRVRNTLKWEAIVNDPIGALLAVGIYAYITYEGSDVSVAAIGLDVAFASLVAAAIGAGLAIGVTWIFPRGLVPEYLKAPILLVTVIAGFVLADLVMHETGLITVTVMGVVMANRPIQSSEALHRFKEGLAVLLVSGLFILLSATLDWEVMSRFRARFVLYLLLMLFVVRPATVLISLFFSSMPWRERVFIAWIAPRGIVAVAVTGLVAIRLSDYGIEDAEALAPLSFAIVIVTIFAHGFSADRFSRWLGINLGIGRDILIVGANGWTIALGSTLKALGLNVTIADPSTLALRAARKEGIATYSGDILDEVTQDQLDMGQYQQLVAATDNDAYNALICADLGPELGFEKLTQLSADGARGGAHARGRVLIGKGNSAESLLARHAEGWRFSRTKVTEKFNEAGFRAKLDRGAEPVALLKPDQRLLLFSTDSRPVAEAGDVIVSFVPPAGG